MNCSVILDNYASAPHRTRTSSERMLAKFRSFSVHPFFLPASMGRTKSCRKDASEGKMAGFTKTESAKSS